MDYLIRFLQIHDTFRKPETDALADLACVKFKWLYYSEHTPFAIIRFPDTTNATTAAQKLIARSILSTSIFELWGEGTDYESLHEDVRRRTESLWPSHLTETFRFEVDSFHGSHTAAEHRSIIETFKYMGFKGRIVMKKPDHQFVVFEQYVLDGKVPERLFFGKFVAESGRKAINKYTLKKRSYIATTSMDSELALVTANLAQAAPGKVAYDPFMGTGSFPLACAHFGAAVCGSDLDGRSIRGKGGRSVKGNFEQYGTSSHYLGGFIADLTNTPLRQERILDAIICDPPYGVREGLKVLGSTKVALQEVVYLTDGRPAHLQENYVPPKKSYSFFRMLDDILDFAAARLVDNGRLCMWMPVAGLADGEGEGSNAVVEKEYAIPSHPALYVKSVCTQDFNKWSRRLLTYQRLPDSQVNGQELLAHHTQRLALATGDGHDLSATANDLNAFRRRYFQGFKDPVAAS